MPSVSIILPTHNGSKYLASAVDSVLAQTYRDFELIIVDDGSTDDTWGIISHYAGIDERVKPIRHLVNKNLPAALNTGFQAAKGEWYTWTSDDNLLNPDMIEKLMVVFETNPEVDIVYSDFDKIREDGTLIATTKTGPANELPIMCNIGASFMYRRKVDQECGGYEEDRFCAEDYAFWLKAYHNRFCFYKLDHSLYQYRVHPNTLTGQKLRTVFQETLRLLMENNVKHADEIPELIRMRSYLRCIKLAQDVDNPQLARECLYQARSIRANADDWTRPELIRYASNEVKTPRRLILFGAGVAGIAALKWMQEEGISVSAFSDNNPARWYQEVEGLPVLKPSMLTGMDSPLVIVTTAYSAISSQLQTLNVNDYHAFYLYRSKFLRDKYGAEAQRIPTTQRALNWILANRLNGGLRVSAQDDLPYPEVTGYTIPTLLDYGYVAEAVRMAEYLVSVQSEEGAFSGPGSDMQLYFDTAQVLRGFLAIEKKEPRFHENAVRAAEWLFSALRDNNGCFPNQYPDSPLIPEAVNLFALPPMLEYARLIGNDDYITLVSICATRLLETPDALSTTKITHFLAYQIDGLIDIGMEDAVRLVMQELAESQNEDGSIPAVNGAPWVILTGCAQLAISYYKLGQHTIANRLMDYLDTVQEVGGGFFGSRGPDAHYFPDKEISWGVKFYLDAQRERVKAFFQDNVAIFPERVDPSDGRLRAIADLIKDGDAVLDAGSGKGRMIRCLAEEFPRSTFTALDISRAMLAFVPNGTVVIEGFLEDIPLPNDAYDVTYCVEAIEHSANAAAVVRELARVTKAGGHIIIIDKHAAEWGRMECPPWESWLERKELEALLNEHCERVMSEPVTYELSDKNDDLIIKWVGVKRGS
ncbi:glycosyltransferase [Cohnella sp. GCM10027633]|uniref:glycosyltransferase n=1 Tax=unclassified Cohnella TaxID=2636738 RepID=UPI00363ED6D2